MNHRGSNIPESVWREHNLDNDPALRMGLEHRFNPVAELFREMLRDVEPPLRIGY